MDRSFHCQCESCQKIRSYAENTHTLAHYASRQAKQNVIKFQSDYELPDGIKQMLVFPGVKDLAKLIVQIRDEKI